MLLLLDVGTTRVKWAWLEYLEIAPAGAVAHNATHRSWQREIEADGHRPTRIVVSNVAGPAFAAALTLWSRDHFEVEPEFIVASSQLLGVTSGYARPTALGVDRWLALIATWRAAPRPTLIVSCGTALTLDALDGVGRHHGGLILPGVQMFNDARGPASRGAVYREGATLRSVPADPVPLALAAAVDRAALELAARVGTAPRLVLTGGDAAVLAPILTETPEIVPDLVLTGLAIVATMGVAGG